MNQTELKTKIKALISGGKTLTEIAADLNKQGITTKTGKPFTQAGVHYWANPYKQRAKRNKYPRNTNRQTKAAAPTTTYDRWAVMKAVHHCNDFTKTTRTALIDLILNA